MPRSKFSLLPKPRQYAYYIGQRGFAGLVEVFATDVPKDLVRGVHPDYAWVLGPFPSRKAADAAADAPWRAEEILAEANKAHKAKGRARR